MGFGQAPFAEMDRLHRQRRQQLFQVIQAEPHPLHAVVGLAPVIDDRIARLGIDDHAVLDIGQILADHHQRQGLVPATAFGTQAIGPAVLEVHQAGRMLLAEITVVKGVVQARGDGAAIEIAQPVEVHLDVGTHLLMQAHAGFAVIDTRAQQDGRALDGVGAKHEQVAPHLELALLGANGRRLDAVPLVFEHAHLRLQAHVHLGMAEQLGEAVLRGELGIDRAQVAGGIGAADATLAGGHPRAPGGHDEMMIGHRLLHEHVDRGALVRRLRKRLAARQHLAHVLVAGDRHDGFGLAVVGLEIGVAQRPVVAHAVARTEGEVAGMQARRLREPAVHAAPQGNGGVPGLLAAVVVGRFRLDEGALLVLDLPVPGMKVAPLDDQGAAGEVFQRLAEKEARTKTGPYYHQLVLRFVDVPAADTIDFHELSSLLHSDVFRAEPSAR